MSFEYIHLWLQMRLIQDSLAYYHYCQKKIDTFARTLCGGMYIQVIYQEFSVCFVFLSV